MLSNQNPNSLDLKAGELVEVRSKEEILSTLDQQGRIDGLPFMPEMFQYCGQIHRVYRRAHKTCDTINNSGLRRMSNAVHLERIRCDGQAHGGCQAACMIFWKEAWLKRAPAPKDTSVPLTAKPTTQPGCTTDDVLANGYAVRPTESSAPIYSCQATRILEATTPMPRGDWAQYKEDYLSGNFGLGTMLSVAIYAGYGNLIGYFKPGGFVRRVLYWIYAAIRLLRGKSRQHPRTRGRVPDGIPTPIENLNLQVGEVVRVKKFDTILNTLDYNWKNRGMTWDAEMVAYCSKTFIVNQRLQQIVDEKTGVLIKMKTPCVTLEGAICRAKYSECRWFCPRSTVAYWRETWLERVPVNAPVPQTKLGATEGSPSDILNGKTEQKT